MEGMKMIMGTGSGTYEAGSLSRSFDAAVRAGDRDALTLALAESEAGANFAAVALAGSMIRYVDRRSRLVLLYGGVGRHLRLAELGDWLTHWAMDLFQAPVSPDSVTPRAAHLQEHLASLADTLPEARAMLAAAGALVDASAPTSVPEAA